MAHIIRFVFTLYFICVASCVELTCSPGVSQTFSWNFSSDAGRTYTFWKFQPRGNTSATTIMRKSGEDEAEKIKGTGFENRIMEDPNSNAGIVIENLQKPDTGSYSVIVHFISGSSYNNDSSIILSEEYAVSEIVKYAKIYVNGLQINATEPQYIGDPELTFSITVSGACVHSTNITIFFNKIPKNCSDMDSCKLIIKEAGDLYVDISVLPYTEGVIFPNKGTFHVGRSQEERSKSCSENMACIVPAIVVPVVVVIVTVVVIVILQKGRN